MDPSQPAGRPEPGDGRLAGAREILSSETALCAYCRAEATDTGHIAPPDRTGPTAATTSSPYAPMPRLQWAKGLPGSTPPPAILAPPPIIAHGNAPTRTIPTARRLAGLTNRVARHAALHECRCCPFRDQTIRREAAPQIEIRLQRRLQGTDRPGPCPSGRAADTRSSGGKHERPALSLWYDTRQTRPNRPPHTIRSQPCPSKSTSASPPCHPVPMVADFVQQCETAGFNGVGILDSQLLEPRLLRKHGRRRPGHPAYPGRLRRNQPRHPPPLRSRLRRPDRRPNSPPAASSSGSDAATAPPPPSGSLPPPSAKCATP